LKNVHLEDKERHEKTSYTNMSQRKVISWESV